MMGLFAPSGVAKAPLATIPLLGTCISAFQVSQLVSELRAMGALMRF